MYCLVRQSVAVWHANQFPFRGTRLYEYADLGPKEEEISRMMRALLDTMKLAEETTLGQPLMKPLNLVALVATGVSHPAHILA